MSDQREGSTCPKCGGTGFASGRIRTPLTEATPKSTRERIYRTLRKDTKHRDRPRKHMIGPALRAGVGKTGNNDPHSNKPRLHNEAIPEKLKLAIIFLRDNIDKSGEEITDAVSLFKNKPELLDLIRHLIATSMGGWQQEQGCFVNDSGQKAYPEHWLLSEDRLIPKGRSKVLEYNINKLLKMKNILELSLGQCDIKIPNACNHRPSHE